MKIITLREFRNNFAAVIDAVEVGRPTTSPATARRLPSCVRSPAGGDRALRNWWPGTADCREWTTRSCALRPTSSTAHKTVPAATTRGSAAVPDRPASGVFDTQGDVKLTSCDHL
jgi:hypothetical protein